MLYLKNGHRTKGDLVAIYYCADLVCENESIAAPSLAARRVGKSPMMGRRLKHFSGYNIAADRPCGGSVDLLDDGSHYCAGALI
jgi:hypothetical protein